MPIITISRGSYSKGKEVAEKVAERLGYQCIAREIILKASKEFNIPEIKFAKAIHDAPSIFDRLTYGREKYIAYLQAAFLKSVQSDNVVYHGLAGHFFLKDLRHALKVRIIADKRDRLQVTMAREGISEEEAERRLKRDDEDRTKWSKHVFGIDTSDPSLYDLVIHIGKMTVPDAVEIISRAAQLDSLMTTYDSQRAMDDLVLAAEVKAALIDLKPDVQVVASDGKVILGTKVSQMQEPEEIRKIEHIARSIPGVKDLEIKTSHRVNWSD
ncbi:MAG: cytidylate kinase family protein [Syntrophobacteraceae bacterium]